jgi:hypothetical protein
MLSKFHLLAHLVYTRPKWLIFGSANASPNPRFAHFSHAYPLYFPLLYRYNKYQAPDMGHK